jgi:hypothetical protein
MGREIRCRVRHDGREAEAKAQLETDELIVRSPFRLAVPRAAIRSATLAGEALEVVYDGGALTLGLGEREAAKWAADIANPKTLADKLGVKAGQRVRLVGAADAELVGAGQRVARARRMSCSWRPMLRPTSSRSSGCATRSPATARSG